MSSAFKKISLTIDHFFAVFYVDKLKTPVGHLGGAAEANAMDSKMLKVLSDAQKDKSYHAACAEVFSAFGEAINFEAGWFTGCKCHDWIWQDPLLSIAAKQALFQERTGGDPLVVMVAFFLTWEVDN